MPQNNIQIGIIATDILDFKDRVNKFYAKKAGSYHGNMAYVIGNVTLFAILYDKKTLRGREIQAVDVTPKAKSERNDLEEMLTAAYRRLTPSGLRALQAAQSINSEE